MKRRRNIKTGVEIKLVAEDEALEPKTDAQKVARAIEVCAQVARLRKRYGGQFYPLPEQPPKPAYRVRSEKMRNYPRTLKFL